jgi:glycosyltransferase involved in cell wall biosynthesis
MESIALVVALITFFYLLATITEFLVGFSKIKNLSQQPILAATKLPSISVILTVLNEEKNIENVINSLVSLEYPDYEVIAINDRSTDKTPEILTRLAQQHSNLKVHKVENLPEGWFGKNHGLHFGSTHARGEWLLFTDADVTMEKDTLLKTISYALEKKLDHLTIHERHYQDGFFMRSMMLAMHVSYNMVMRPWRISFAWSKKSVGRAAFNLVKRSSYLKCGGHKLIALECLDDLKLGELMKKSGMRQDVVDAHEFVEFKWYSTLREFVVGLEKNGFAFFNYAFLAAFRDIFFAMIFYFLPIIAVIYGSGQVREINVLNMLLTFALTAIVAQKYRVKIFYALFYPIGISMLLYTIVKSMIATYKNKGVIWRGNHYPLAELRKQKIII